MTAPADPADQGNGGADALVRVVREDGVAWLTLNRPDAGNAIDLPTARALSDAARDCAADAAIRCVVLTGAGRLFCAGGDVRAMAAAERPDLLLEALAGTLHQSVMAFAEMAKPLLTLVNGPAAGAGLSLAIAGDVVLCARSAHFTAAYGAIGLTPDGGMSWWLPRLVGLRRAQEIVLANRRVGAEEAAAIGMATRVVDDEALPEEGRATARALAAAATGAVGATRALLRRAFATDLATHLDAELAAIVRAGAGAEAREGLAAFLGRRAADFAGQRGD